MPDEAKEVWWKYIENFNTVDFSGKPIIYLAYGNPNSKYGWDIDHILPLAENGKNTIENLQPINIGTNKIKADNINGEIQNIYFINGKQKKDYHKI